MVGKQYKGEKFFFASNKIAYINRNSSKYGNVTKLEFNNAIKYIHNLHIFRKIVIINDALRLLNE